MFGRMATEDFGEVVETPSVEVKLFGKWSADEVHVNDISLAVSARCVLRLNVLRLMHVRVSSNSLSFKNINLPYLLS